MTGDDDVYLPDLMVENAAKAFVDYAVNVNRPGPPWDERPESHREEARSLARMVLAAALVDLEWEIEDGCLIDGSYQTATYSEVVKAYGTERCTPARRVIYYGPVEEGKALPNADHPDQRQGRRP